MTRTETDPSRTEWIINASDKAVRISKAAAGRQLDVRAWDQFPQAGS